MTFEKIKEEVNKMPQEDKASIKLIRNLSDEEMANVTGGVTETTESILRKLHLDKTLNQTTKNILEKLAIAEAFVITAGVFYYIGYNKGYNKGCVKGSAKKLIFDLEAFVAGDCDELSITRDQLARISNLIQEAGRKPTL